MLQQTETTFKGLTIWLEGENKKIVKQAAAALTRWVKLNQENLFERKESQFNASSNATGK